MRRITVSAIAATLLFAAAASAQEAPALVMGQYMRCSVGQEMRADEIVRAVWAPIVQKHVDAGHLTGWAWLTHVQGGAWRRVFVITGADLDTMMDVSAQMVTEIQGEHADAAKELGTICSSHDDYIWTSVANSPANPDATAGPAMLSTYYVCDAAREQRANEIFVQLLAPLYKKHADMGHLAGWAFYAHRSGGQFRRLETSSGADHKTLLKMQTAIYEEAQQLDPLAFNEFRQVCGSHTDYMWSRMIQQ
jgi:hypothetical protein